MTETPPTDQGQPYEQPEPVTDPSAPRREGGGRWWGLGLVAFLFVSFLVSFLIGNRMLMPFQESAERDTNEDASLEGQEARLPSAPETEVVPETMIATPEEPAVPTPPPAVEMPPAPVKMGHLYRVQAGAFSGEEDAVVQSNRLKDKGYTTFVREGDDALWRVQVGAFENRKGAELLVSDLKEKGFEAFIVTE